MVKSLSRWGFLIILLLLLVAGASIALAWGSVAIPWQRVLTIIVNPAPTEKTLHTILVQLRLPRIILSLLVGFSLAMSGCVFQGLLRNPMADPYLVGVSAGAGVGALLALYLGWQFKVLGFAAGPFLAFIGGLATVFLVYRLARIGGKVPVTSFLLSGVAVGFLLNAIMSLLMVLMSRELHRVLYWLMGSFAGKSWSQVAVIIPYFIVGSVLIIWQSRNLNLLVLGEEAAYHLGVDVERSKTVLIFGATTLTASAVAVSGLVGFVGLIIPHIVRLISGPDHRTLIPLSGLAGGVFLLWGDTIARSLLPPIEIPVGVITALAGGPFFLYLLRRHKQDYFGRG